MTDLSPRDERDVVELLGSAVAEGRPIEVFGFHTKRGLGRPVSAEMGLRTTMLTGIKLYEPNEMVITASAGTPLQDIVEVIGKQGQRLAFEPPDCPGLYGETCAGSIGGAIAVNAGGSRRISAGAARDHLLGFRAVSGHGKVFKSGGRVMKNVTGYDLSKLVSGSFGTLAVLTEVTLKVVPKAETEKTLMFPDLDEVSGLKLLRTASGLHQEVSCFAYFPGGTAESRGARSLTAMRVEGSSISVKSRCESLLVQLRPHRGEALLLEGTKSSELWRNATGGAALRDRKGTIWKISTAPGNAAALMAELAAANIPVESHYFDWAGGLIWLALQEGAPAHATAIREVVDAFEGHATLMRASDAERLAEAVFHPRSSALSALYRNIKDAFDPGHLLNRGRLSSDY
jgi:glycolate oxidase FAD binding subunit